MLKYISIFITGYDLKKNSPGLGPNITGYWRILLPYSGLFYDASYEHDKLYTQGGNELDMRLANSIFFAMCLAKSKTKLTTIFARLYYFLVTCYGYKYFSYK